MNLFVLLCRSVVRLWPLLLPLLLTACPLSSKSKKDEAPVVTPEPVREPNSNADLAALPIQGGTLSPAFDTAQYDYSVSLVNSQHEIAFLPELADTERFVTARDDLPGCVDINSSELVVECARLLVNGSPIDQDHYGGWLRYNVGAGAATTVTFEVIAEDGTVRHTYSVAVAREAETLTNANIEGLLLSTGSVNETVAADTLSYSATVGYLTKQIRIKAVPRQFNATIKVNTLEVSQGQFSQAIALAEGANAVTIQIIAPDGVTSRDYTLNITRQALADFAQRAYIKASNPEAGDGFGYSVALEGDLMAIGAPFEDSAASGVDGDQLSDCELTLDAKNCEPDSGAVYLLRRIGGVWSQEAYLKANYPRAGDRFGHKVVLEHGSLLVSAPYQDAGTSKLMQYHDCDVDVEEQVNCIPDSGAIYEFVKMSDQWEQIAYLKSVKVMGGVAFGWDMARDGDNLVVGVPYDSADVSTPTQRVFQDLTQLNANLRPGDMLYSGAVLIYSRQSGAWQWRAYIKAATVAKEDLFGWSVAIQDDSVVNLQTLTVAVGAPFSDDATLGQDIGATYVFSRSGSAWTQLALLHPDVACPHDLFGSSVALSFDSLAVGAPLEDGLATDTAATLCDAKTGNGQGAVYLFERGGVTWAQQAYLKASGVTTADAVEKFGQNLALDGDTLVTGAVFEDSNATGVNGDASNNALYSSGAAYTFTRSGTTWTQRLYIKAATTDAADEFGAGFALAGENLLIFASGEASDGTGVNGSASSDNAPASGAVYLFR